MPLGGVKGGDNLTIDERYLAPTFSLEKISFVHSAFILSVWLRSLLSVKRTLDFTLFTCKRPLRKNPELSI